jgi:GT2 family glycosyltransferase
VLVVGMHRSGTSAVASALGELGLALPREGDLLGARFGNEKGHFESLSLMSLGDDALRQLGGTWDDPPELPPDPANSEELRRLSEAAPGIFEAAFDAPDRPVCWKDPRTALLVPFWRQVIDRPIAGVLVGRDPLEVARSLDRRNGLGLPLCLALWERYVRRSMEGLRGLPVFVSVFADIINDPEQWKSEIAEWLSSLGLTPRDRVVPLDPESQHERRAREQEPAADKLVLPAQMQLYGELLSLRGPHERFDYEPAGAEAPWTTALLEQRRDSIRLWRGLGWAASEIRAQLPETPLGATSPGPAPITWDLDAPGRYPLDATNDEPRYHRWLEDRGETTTIAPRTGLAAPVTGPASASATGSASGPSPAATLPGPMFSIVVPCWRPPIWALDRCISSVLTQDFASFELCLCDDGSNDPALSARLEEAAHLDPRVHVDRLEQNGGISTATNRAIERATGRYLVFLDNDDELHVSALVTLAEAIARYEADNGGVPPDLVYSDEDKIDETGRRFMPAFKPDWSPDLLLSNAYMCHVLVVRRELVAALGGLRSEFDGAQDHDLMLRVTEQTDRILHVPEILYHWRIMLGSAAGDPNAKPWALEAGRLAVADAVRRRGIDADVIHHGTIGGSYHVRRRPSGRHLVSAIIPFRDEAALLAACYRSFIERPGYEQFELLLVDNDSALPETRAVLNELSRDQRVRVVQAPGPFDFAAINNAAAAKARGDLLLFMNNDVEARGDGWLAAMVAQAERPEIGAVGARLLFPDGTIQHAGVAVGVCWGAAHLLQGIEGHRPGYLSLTSVTRNFMAVTAACMMTRRSVFEEMGGFDASLPIAFNDTDFCLRLHEAGYLVVCTPLAELVHHESKSRGHSDDAKELPYFRSRWRSVMLAGDPYYNPNLGRFDCHCRLPTEEDEERWATFRSMLGESSTT